MLQQATTRPPCRSVYDECIREAEVHKWIESQKRGHDVGHAAIKEWFSKYWLTYCRHRSFEHLEGKANWVEFGEDRFGHINSLKRYDLLFERIYDRILNGWENLDVICWAREWGLPMEPVIDILGHIDINAARLDPISDFCYA